MEPETNWSLAETCRQSGLVDKVAEIEKLESELKDLGCDTRRQRPYLHPPFIVGRPMPHDARAAALVEFRSQQSMLQKLDGLRNQFRLSFWGVMKAGGHSACGRRGSPSAALEEFPLMAWQCVVEMDLAQSNLELALPDGKTEFWYDMRSWPQGAHEPVWYTAPGAPAVSAKVISFKRDAKSATAHAAGRPGRRPVYDWPGLKQPLEDHVRQKGPFVLKEDLVRWCAENVKLKAGARRPKGDGVDLKNAKAAIEKYGLYEIGMAAPTQTECG